VVVHFVNSRKLRFSGGGRGEVVVSSIAEKLTAISSTLGITPNNVIVFIILFYFLFHFVFVFCCCFTCCFFLCTSFCFSCCLVPKYQTNFYEKRGVYSTGVTIDVLSIF